MENKGLSGIERDLVLRYLIDGNVPVTLTPAEEGGYEEGKIRPLRSAVFPVALTAEHFSVLKEGIILLKNPPQSVVDFEGKDVRVEFYFNRVGLFFVTTVKTVKSGLALVIPQTISRIEDVPVRQKYDFSAVLYYSVGTGEGVNFLCVPAEGFRLFSRPVWSSIVLEKQREAKEYLEQFVEEAKKKRRAGNGIQLINVCRYITEDRPQKTEALEGRVRPLDILFIDHERIVLGYLKNEAFSMTEGGEYAVRISFSLIESRAVMRDVFVTCAVDNLYTSRDGTRICADCSYTGIQKEDCRFLYEKASSALFV